MFFDFQSVFEKGMMLAGGLCCLMAVVLLVGVVLMTARPKQR